MTDIHSCSYYCERPECIKAQRDELRSRLAQPEQEPVAYIEHHKGGDNLVWDDPGGKRSPLYTTPPQRKPLTDEARAVIDAARAAMDASTEADDGEGGIKIASHIAASLSLCLDEYDRAIGRAHGIKGEA